MFFYTAYQNQKKTAIQKNLKDSINRIKIEKHPVLTGIKIQKKPYQHMVKSILRTAYLTPPLRY